ncbi:aldo/keto reductase [Synechococcus sp. Minos11]|uniref:aldo/keto reductase n=1 Tax=Synechococcus sp. Minos11 TaxID=221341 RepID=UPI00164971A2|nr:aldo/keto reductase [Synechococcus sp. Minos11]
MQLEIDENLKHFLLHNLDITLSKLGFGTSKLHHVSFDQRIELLCTALDRGITHFDTAPIYGLGTSEIALGTFLFKRRSAVTVTTKFGLYPRTNYAHNNVSLYTFKLINKLLRYDSPFRINFSVQSAKSSLTSSLKRLRTDYIDFLFLHEPYTYLLHPDELLAWLEDEKRAGRIRAWGIAGFQEHILDILSSSPELAPVIQTHCTSFRSNYSSPLLPMISPQFEFGFVSSILKKGNYLSSTVKLKNDCCHLFSTSSLLHLSELVSLCH